MTLKKVSRRPARPPVSSTRERILAAAIDRFSKHSYEETGLRDIAADVGVDVAYVHRCFGSKERLFAAALEATIQPARFRIDDTDDLATNLARQIFARDTGRSRNTAGPLDIVIRSLSSPEASHVLRDFVSRDFIEPIASKTGSATSQRVALVAALLTGVGILRNVLRVTPLLETGDNELESLVADTLRIMLGQGHGQHAASLLNTHEHTGH